MTGLRFSAAALAVALATGAAPAATISIDTFAEPATATSFQVTAPSSGTLASPFSMTLNNQIVRTVSYVAAYTPPPPNPTAPASTFTIGGGGTGALDLATPSNSTVSAAVAYTNLGAAGLSNFKALGATAVHLEFLYSDLNVPFYVQLTSAGGTSTSAVIPVSANNAPASFDLALSSFTGNADLTKLTGVTVQLNTPNGAKSADFTLSNVGVDYTKPTTVPAPAAALLGLFAVPALALRRFRA